MQRQTPSIADHELLRPIGHGSYGEVWLARSATGTLRAVKVVYRASFEQDKPYEREFGGIQKFEPISRDHEGHIDILHVGRDDAAGYFYYVMELADRAERTADEKTGSETEPEAYVPRTLRGELRRGALGMDECVSVGLSLARALAHLHQHDLVHRDIKPSNIVFVNGVPKLADIGLVTGVDATRSFVGTIGFIPPEGPGTPQADIYSLGKVLYEMSTGKDREDFPQLPADLRLLPGADRLVEFNEVLLKACHKDARQRYPNAQGMVEDLELLQRGESVQSKHVWERRRALVKTVCVGTGAMALLAIAASTVWTRFYSDQTNNREANRLDRQGSYLLHKWSDSNDASAIEVLEKSVALNPNSASAHARLAQAYVQKAFWEGATGEPREPKAAAEIATALELDPNCAEAFVARGKLLWSPREHFQHEAAVRDFKHALQLDPNLAEAYHQVALVYVHVGLFDKASQASQEGQRLDPLNAGARFRAGVADLYAGRYSEALNVLNGMPRSFQPDLLAAQTATALFYLHRTAEAEAGLTEFLSKNPDDPLSHSTLAILYAARGDTNMAETEIRLAKAKEKQYMGHYHHVSYNIASSYALMNNSSNALIWLRKTADDGYPCYPRFENDANLKTLRGDPEFKSFMHILQARFEHYKKTL